MNNILKIIIASIVCWTLIITASIAYAATIWTEQTGQFYKYDKTPNNLTDTSWDYALTTDTESVNENWTKQNGVFIQCKSSGGSNRYYPTGYDCATGQPKVIVLPPPLTPPADAINCAAENQICTIPSGVTATVWYGIGDKWVVKDGVTGGIQCSNSNFGKDPAPGTLKKCLYKVSVSASPAPMPVTQTCDAYMCVNEREEIIFKLHKNSVLVCPEVKITKEQIVMSFEGKQANTEACR